MCAQQPMCLTAGLRAKRVELSVCLKFCRVLKLASPFDAEGNIHLQRPMPVAIGSMARGPLC